MPTAAGVGSLPILPRRKGKAMTIYQGVDASAYQGNIDWQRVRSFHIDFAILRATMGWGNAEYQIDRQFHHNMHDATEAGLLTGAYHSSLAANADDAHREAEFFIKCIRGYKMAYPVAIDIGDRTLRYLPPEKLDLVVRAWCGDVREAGYYPMICADLQTATNRLNPLTIQEFDIWLLKHGDSTDYEGDIGMWQYTAAASIGGVKSRIGKSRALRDFPTIMREHGLGGFDLPAKAARSPEPISLFSASSPLMQAFDTLSELSAFLDIMKAMLENDDLVKKLIAGDALEHKEPNQIVVSADTESKPDESQNEPLAEVLHKPSPEEKAAEQPDQEQKENTDDHDKSPPAAPVISAEKAALLDKVLEENEPLSRQHDQSEITDKPFRPDGFENPEDNDIQDEEEERREARMLHGRWSWFS